MKAAGEHGCKHYAVSKTGIAKAVKSLAHTSPASTIILMKAACRRVWMHDAVSKTGIAKGSHNAEGCRQYL